MEYIQQTAVLSGLGNVNDDLLRADGTMATAPRSTTITSGAAAPVPSITAPGAGFPWWMAVLAVGLLLAAKEGR